MIDHTADREHPAAEKLSAYEANELSPEETDAIREHVASCSLCAERLVDLQRFLDYTPDTPSREAVADLETAVDWRRLWRRIQASRETPVRRFFRSPGARIAAALAVALIWASYRIMSLERELAEPITDLGTTTLEASGSRKGEPSPPEPVTFRLGHIAAFETLSDRPYHRYRLVFLDENGRIRRSVEDTEDADGMITLFLPQRFVAPSRYRVEILGIDGSTTHLIRRFEIQITR